MEKDIEKELETLSPFLAKMKREQSQTGFDVPPTYFKNLPVEVMNTERRMANGGRQTAAAVNGWKRILDQLCFFLQPRLAMGVAALLLLLMGIWYSSNNETTVLADTEPTLEELEEYIAANLDDFSEDLLLEYETETPTIELDIENENLDLLLDDLEIEDLL